ncbi:MAG: hypothetical protein TR69_WS6001000031 [candidate division WS6 bacterium OLB20]|uniref:Uncharacterized protein n=1 Tax=candidate division WS6 bacterium OLB20 TaxID=1617426 RepID=A0A136M133_9BACT|nr:MAG: hypothetical protein TR69_WS6001000031 [candidate division WS6 bacterium OLB20]
MLVHSAGASISIRDIEESEYLFHAAAASGTFFVQYQNCR